MTDEPMTAGEMCLFCGEDTEDHRNPFGLLASGVYGCRSHTDAEILRAWCEQRLAGLGGMA